MPNPPSSIPGSSIPDRPAFPVLTDRAKSFIGVRLARGEKPERIAAGLRTLLEIEIDPVQVIPFWRGELVRPTQAERRADTERSADKESVQLAADAEQAPLLTRRPPDETSAADSKPALPYTISKAATPEVAPEVTATQTGHRQDQHSLQIPADMVDEPTVQDNAVDALGELVKVRLGLTPDPAAAKHTGRRQDRKTPTVLTDEVKAFIVRALARYETPTRVAASVQSTFGIAIDRRQVFAYDPAGSRPPAQRWIELHAATRAKFLLAAAEIGVAQKVVRLRMLDRYANRADEYNQMERAAAFLAQAAKECGGFYERFQRPKADA